MSHGIILSPESLISAFRLQNSFSKRKLVSLLDLSNEAIRVYLYGYELIKPLFSIVHNSAITLGSVLTNSIQDLRKIIFVGYLSTIQEIRPMTLQFSMHPSFKYSLRKTKLLEVMI